MIAARELDVDVLTAARERIINVFSNGVPVYLSFSGGKDSIVLGDIIYNLILEGRIDPSLLTVHFIDEESMYDCCIDIVKKWRKKFMLVGVKFEWYCLEILHYNCLNQLADEEKYVVWDRYKKDVWIRPMPEFAITQHPLFKPRQETYQSFLTKLECDGISLIGMRIAESIQRKLFIGAAMTNKNGVTGATGAIYPIFDWKDEDIWLYIKNNDIEFPDVYKYLYQVGIARGNLRISQFFAIDTIRTLYKLAEYYPDLMERVCRREPNAYMVALYFDTEMFGRQTRARTKAEANEENKDYKSLVLDVFKNPSSVINSDNFVKRVVPAYKKLYLKFGHLFTEGTWKKMYAKLITGDPKCRGYRALANEIIGNEIKRVEGRK